MRCLGCLTKMSECGIRVALTHRVHWSPAPFAEGFMRVAFAEGFMRVDPENELSPGQRGRRRRRKKEAPLRKCWASECEQWTGTSVVLLDIPCQRE